MKKHFPYSITQRRSLTVTLACVVLLCAFVLAVIAQTEVTGAFEGKVVSGTTNEPIKDAVVRIIQKETGVPRTTRTNGEGKFFQGMLQPGTYTISISAPGYKTIETTQRLVVTKVIKVMPYPTMLEPESAPQR